MLKPNNYYFISRLARRSRRLRPQHHFTIHKTTENNQECQLSIILLDWSCRERFHTLDWLSQQTVPRHRYELIWIELYSRVIPEVLEKVDVHITCEQKGIYHKHIGYNLGLLQAKGNLICVCDSDAVYPPDFVESILDSFHMVNQQCSTPLVLMHYQKRTSLTYPEDLTNTRELDNGKWNWWKLHPNVGACMTVRKADAIRYGGFDEHKSYRGYICGPYELGWRLVNAGLPEIWHDTVIAWHFAHPDPVGGNEMMQTIGQILEIKTLHIDCHAFNSVEAFSTGRLLPLKENPEIFALRMKDRHIGTLFEEKYSCMTGQEGFSTIAVVSLWFSVFVDIVWSVTGDRLLRFLFHLFGLKNLKEWYERLLAIATDRAQIVVKRKGDYNILRYEGRFYGIPLVLKEVNPEDPEQLQNPLIFSSRDMEGIEELICAQGYERSCAIREPYPKIIKSQGDYNIVRFRGRFYGFPLSLGEIDPEAPKQLQNPLIFSARDIRGVEKLIRNAMRSNTRNRKSFLLSLVNKFFQVFPLKRFEKLVPSQILAKLRGLYRALKPSSF